MDPLTEFAVFLFSWMVVILAVTTLGRKTAAWLRKRTAAEPVGSASPKTVMRVTPSQHRI